MTTTRLGGLCFALVLIGGCATDYYKVHDPTTGKDYYTTEIKRSNNGAATLKDGRTGHTVNLQNSEIAKVTKEQYDAGRFAAPTPPPEKSEPNPFNK
jgi:hypothetical protein